MNLAQIAALTLGTVIAEGFVLARMPGADPFFGVSRSPSAAFFSGVGIMLAMFLASAATWPVGRLLGHFGLFHLQTLFFLAVIAGIAMLLEHLQSKMPPRMRALLGIHPKSIALNGAVMGVAAINTALGAGFWAALGYALATGAGFTVVSVLFASVRDRVSLASNCPKAMQGLPIALLTAGLLALAFTGFLGLKPIAG